MLPSVTITEIDGALGTLPTGLRAFAAVGAASAGPLNTPVALARTTDVVSTFVRGPLVEMACRKIKITGKPVICVRAAATTVGTHTDIVTTGVSGTSVVTIDSGDTSADDDYEPLLRVITGGTIGVAGITLQWSLDGGRTMSPTTALGTATFFTFPNSGNIGYSFAAGTLVAGDEIASLAKAPQANAADVTAALDALMNYGAAWECAVITGPLDGTIFDAVDAEFAAKPEKFFVGAFRLPTAGESDATYQAAFNTAFSAKATTHGAVFAGAWEVPSAGQFAGRTYRRPALFAAAPRLYSVSEEVDIAQPDLGSVGGSLRDELNNPKHHDERINPGLDDMRAGTLCTIEDLPGVYVTNPRLLSAAGSDFEFIQHRRIMILARIALRLYFTFRLSRPVIVDPATGFLTDEQREEINVGARTAMANVLLAKPKASDVDFALSATDNVLATKTLTGSASVVPLAYPKTFEIALGFRNPALQVSTNG